MNYLDQVAPYPKQWEDATAEAMLRYQLARVAMTRPVPPAGLDEVEMAEYYVAAESWAREWALAYLLRQLIRHSDGDLLAQNVWSHWDCGDSMPDWLLDQCDRQGLDISEIERLRRDARQESDTDRLREEASDA